MMRDFIPSGGASKSLSTHQRLARAIRSVEPLECRTFLSVSVAAGTDGLDEPASAPAMVASDIAQEPFDGSPITLGTEGDTRFEFENYDTTSSDSEFAGEGVAYHDTTPSNLGGAYRTDEAVDVTTTTDTLGGYRLTKVAAGEWTEYTVFVEDGGTFTFDMRVSSSTTGGKFHIESDGVDVSGPIAVPDTGSFNTFTTVTKTGVPLATGLHVLRFSYDTNDTGSDSVGGFNWVQVNPEGETTEQRPFSDDDSAHAIRFDSGGGFALEDFDYGGETVAYHDTTVDNIPGAYRPNESVDIKQIKGTNNYRLSNVAAGEWTEYTVFVPIDYAFTMTVRASQSKPGGVFHVEVDGADVSGPLKVPDTGSFDTFRDVTKTVWLPSSAHVMRFAFDRNADGSDSVGGFDNVSFTPLSSARGVEITNAAYVRSGASANKNFGSDYELQVKRGSGTDYNRETLLKLDLSSIPSISTARLRLDGLLSADAEDGVQVALFASSNTSWDEKTVTWNTRPSTTGAALATTTVRGTDVKSYEFNLTNFLQAQKAAGKKTVALVLRGVTNTDAYVKFLSDDQSSGHPILLYTK